jgi:hypothetical protein
MASIDGFPVFGRSVTSWLNDDPRANQENAFAGLNGQEGLDLGARGSFCHFKGLIAGYALIVDYLLAENAIRLFKDGRNHTLIDTYGRTFYRARLLEFNPEQEPIRFDTGKHGWHKPYTATFRIYDRLS